jgi:hypothetical protein
MAYFDRIWMFADNKEDGTVHVFSKLKPHGEAQVQVNIPANFHKALVDMCQKAVDLHEAQARAEILADEAINQPKE